MQSSPQSKTEETADVCFIAEGTYPYVTGGVSSWMHNLIKTQPHLTFHIVCILPSNADPVIKFDLPSNVIGITNIFLQKLPEKVKWLRKKERVKFFQEMEMPLINMQHKPPLIELKKLLNLFNEHKSYLGRDLLLNSKEAWNLIVRMYNTTMGETSFIDYFWSWRGLFSGFFSILLADIPKAKVYHTSCTGYAGLYISRCFLETEKPCIVTEHGIYTNERMIQLTASDWLHELSIVSFSVDRKSYHRDLKDLWMDLFSGYAFLTYQACEKILTLYEGNIPLQIADGAEAYRIQIIPNGVDTEFYGKIKRKHGGKPVIGLIGRVVPIKDIQTFIKAAAIIRKSIPDVECWVLGPADEDPAYYQNCQELVSTNDLQNNFKFMGKVNVRDYLGKIDIIVLTSISEAQPLVILEAGAVGIPFVSTNVGCCSEYAWGRSDEEPSLGEAGIICPLANPQKIAEGILKMVQDKEYYENCGKAIQQRTQRYYSYDTFVQNYKTLYDEMIELSILTTPNTPAYI